MTVDSQSTGVALNGWDRQNGPYFLQGIFKIVFFNIGSGNGLVPSGNKPLPEPMLTNIIVCFFNFQICSLWYNWQ